MNNDQRFGPTQPVDVSADNIKCADCNVPITQLPFQPRRDETGKVVSGSIRCRDCHQKSRQNRPPRRY